MEKRPVEVDIRRLNAADRDRAWFGEGFDEVLTSARAGGDWAWRELYVALSPTVLGYVRGRGARDPDDLLSQVFLDVVRALETFSGDQYAFRAWVLTIARRRVIDEYRRRSIRSELEEPAEFLETLGPTGDVEREAIARVEVDRTIAAIRELTPDQQDVLLLRLVGDLSVEDVARILGKRANAVKTLQHRGLAALARKIPKETVTL